jgi:hypothetical protein
MTILLCMVLFPMDWISLGRVAFCLKAVAMAATERPDAPARRVCLNFEENSVADFGGNAMQIDRLIDVRRLQEGLV